MNQCWHCGEEIEADDEAQEEVVDLPTGGWAFVHVECPKKLPALTLQYREAKARLEYAQGEVDRIKGAIDLALGAREGFVACGLEVRRVPGTLTKKWDNASLNALVYTLRQTDKIDLAEAIVACRFEEPRRGYLRIGPVK